MYLFQNKNITNMSGMLFLMVARSLLEFEAKEGDEGGITGRKVILTCLFILYTARKFTQRCELVVGTLRNQDVATGRRLLLRHLIITSCQKESLYLIPT